MSRFSPNLIAEVRRDRTPRREPPIVFFLAAALFLLLLNTACKKPRVLLQPGGKLSASELKNICKIHPYLAHFKPGYNALWIRNGITRHVFIGCNGIGSITMPHEVFIFDGDGAVVGANIVQAPNPSTPMAVIGVAPLQIEFQCLDGETMAVGDSCSQEAARHEIQRWMNLFQKEDEVQSAWKLSGSTNEAVLEKKLDDEFTTWEKSRSTN